MITSARAREILDQGSRHFGADLDRFMTPAEEFEVRQAWLSQPDGHLSFRDALVKVACGVELAPAAAEATEIEVAEEAPVSAPAP